MSKHKMHKMTESTVDSQIESKNGPSPAEMYENYLVPGIHARWTPIFLDYAQPEEGERVLDVACGTGIVTRGLAPAVGADGHVVALDVSPDMLEVARRLVPSANVEWVQGDVHDLPFQDGEFDLVVCQQGMQFFEDPDAAVAEMHRVVEPDGRVTLSVWEGLEMHPLYAALCKAQARYLDTTVEPLATPFLMGDSDALRARFDEAGFRRVDIHQETHEVRFPNPKRFVTLTLLAAASIIPESEMDEERRQDMIRTISREIEPTLNRFVDGDEVAFPMHAHIAVGYA